jgi:hypothetical protein
MVKNTTCCSDGTKMNCTSSPENATWKFPLITPYRRATSKERYYYEWHSICVFGESDNQLLHQILCKGSWLYIEGHLSRRRTLNWRHQPQFWYEIVVPWNGKGNGHRVVRVAFQVCFL